MTNITRFKKCSWAGVVLLTVFSGAIVLAQSDERGVVPFTVGTGSKSVTEGATTLPIHSLPGKNPSGSIDGAAALAPIFLTDAQHIHEGVFSDGLDLSDGPNPGDASPALPCSDSSNPFCNYIANNTSAAHASTPDFGKVLGQAIGDAQGELGKLNPGILADALKLLKTLAGGDSENVRFAADNQPVSRFVGYTPEYGRWLHEERFKTVNSPPFHFADPLAMSNVRLRGARLYCAARQAQNVWQNSSTKSMGKLTAFSVRLFGQNIDFLTVEPTLVIDGPLPYLGGQPRCPIVTGCSGGSPEDGAQAFMVPFLAGTQITPVSLLPSLPEIQVPVVMVSGDSEVLTPAANSAEQKTYQTVTHSDAILSSEVTGGAASKTQLYSIGPVKIFLDLGMGFGVGQLFSDGHIGTPDTAVSNVAPPKPPAMVSPLPNDRLLDNVPSFGLSARSGGVSGPFEDSAWLAPSAFTANTTATQSVITEPNNNPPIAPAKISLTPSNPFLVRALADDDRLVWNTTTLGLLGGVHAEPPPMHFGIDAGGISGSIDAQISAGGNVTVNASMRHTLRDSAMFFREDAAPPEGPGRPISAVTIEPSVQADAHLDLFLDLDLEAKIHVFGFDKSVTIFNGHVLKTDPPINLGKIGDINSPWPEANRFRLGTGSPTGDPLKAPDVPSHFPNAFDFASFPSGAGVDSCLADPQPNVPPPPPCAAQPPASTTPPSADMCIYAGAPPNALPLPPNVCSEVAGYVNKGMPGITAAQRKCALDKFTFLCQPVSKTQSFEGPEVVARIFDPTNQAEMVAVHDIVQECVQASPGQNIQTVAEQVFKFGVCDASAILYTPNQIATPGSPPIPGPGSCH